jgi:hypothetical protein
MKKSEQNFMEWMLYWVAGRWISWVMVVMTGGRDQGKQEKTNWTGGGGKGTANESGIMA